MGLCLLSTTHCGITALIDTTREFAAGHDDLSAGCGHGISSDFAPVVLIANKMEEEKSSLHVK